MSRKNYVLAKEIANTLNEINHNTFTETEIKEGIKEYMYMLENEKYAILNVLHDELINGNKSVKELTKKVLAY